jgi:hypothetical protein
MRNVFMNGLAAAALLFAWNASAQPPVTGYTQRDLPKAPPDDYQRGLALIHQAKSDLDRSTRDSVPNPGDHYRYATARGELDRLQQNWQTGSYTRNQLNATIAQLERVLNWNHISPGSRDLLSADLERLRDFRVEHFH